jgi:hypothetical protein
MSKSDDEQRNIFRENVIRVREPMNNRRLRRATIRHPDESAQPEITER